MLRASTAHSEKRARTPRGRAWDKRHERAWETTTRCEERHDRGRLDSREVELATAELIGEELTRESRAGRARRERRAAHIAEMRTELLNGLLGTRRLGSRGRGHMACASKHDEQVAKR